MRVLLAVVLLSLVAASCGIAGTRTIWSKPATRIVFDSQAPHHVRVLVRQVGTKSPLEYDDTTRLELANGAVEHSSGWKRIDLKRFGVPANAKAAILTFKAVITKGPDEATTDVYAFARAPGAPCCHGIAPHPELPVDYDLGQNNGAGIEGMVAQASGYRPYDTARQWVPSTIVPVKNGVFEFSWGYQRAATDALGIGVYLDGWLK